MARPLRIEFAGALYHVTARGNAQGDIYTHDEERVGERGQALHFTYSVLRENQ